MTKGFGVIYLLIGVIIVTAIAGVGGWEVFVPYAANEISEIDLIPQNDVISMQRFSQILPTFKFN